MRMGACCETCGEPFTLREKFNGGAGGLFYTDRCDCGEKDAEAYVERMAARIKRQRAEGFL